jgi:GTP1/Obg family GTP-binding protein
VQRLLSRPQRLIAERLIFQGFPTRTNAIIQSVLQAKAGSGIGRIADISHEVCQNVAAANKGERDDRAQRQTVGPIRKTKRKVEEKIDVLAQSIAYLAEAIQNIEAEIETIKRSLG